MVPGTGNTKERLQVFNLIIAYKSTAEKENWYYAVSASTFVIGFYAFLFTSVRFGAVPVPYYNSIVPCIMFYLSPSPWSVRFGTGTGTVLYLYGTVR